MTFEELLKSAAPAVERFVKFRVDRHQDAEGIIQDTYLAAFRGFANLRDESAFKPWILQIARRKIADWARERTDTLPIDQVPEEKLGFTRWGRSLMPAVSDAMDALDSLIKKPPRNGGFFRINSVFRIYPAYGIIYSSIEASGGPKHGLR